MTKMGRFKRLLSLGLLTVMTVTTIAGCGKKDKKDEDSIVNQAAKGSKDYVYDTEEIFVDGLNFSYIEKIALQGDRLFCAVVDYNKFDAKVASFNLDGSDPKITDIELKENEYLSNFVFNEDGSFYALWRGDGKEKEVVDAASFGSSEESEESSSEASTDEKDESSTKDSSAASSDSAKESSSDAAAESSSEAEEEESHRIDYSSMKYYLAKYDAQGKLQDKINPGDATEEYFEINSMVPYKDGKVVLSTSRGIETYSDAEGFKTIVDTQKSGSPFEGATIYLSQGSEGQIFAQCYGGSGQNYYKLDTEKGAMSDPLKGIDLGTGYYSSSMFGGNGYDVYISDQNNIYGYDLAKEQTVKLMDFVDSDVDAPYGLGTAVAISGEEIIAAILNADGNYSLCKLTKIPADQVKDKTIVTLGGSYFDPSVREQVVKFNHENDKYKIKIVDYSSYNTEDDYDAGNKKFDMDIVSGNVPDIMMFSAGSAPIDKYRSKGVFLDLKPYFDKDEDMKNIEILPNIYNAMLTGDKLYTVIPSFNIMTMMTNKKLADGKNTLTFEDCEDAMNKMGTSYDSAFGLVDKNNFLFFGLIFAADTYIDWDNKKCNLNSDGFIKLLEAANNLPEQINWEEYAGDEDKLYQNKKAIFRQSQLYGFREYQIAKQCIFGDEVSFVGYPNELGENQSCIIPDSVFAISSHTKYADAAWSFVKGFLSDEYQTGRLGYLPSTKAGFDAACKNALEKPFYMEGDEKVYYDDFYYSDDKEIKLKPLTQEEVDYVVDFINSVDKVIYYFDEEVINIVSEEAAAYFSGQKSAKEVADIIQSRVSICVTENG